MAIMRIGRDAYSATISAPIAVTTIRRAAGDRTIAARCATPYPASTASDKPTMIPLRAGMRSARNGTKYSYSHGYVRPWYPSEMSNAINSPNAYAIFAAASVAGLSAVRDVSVVPDLSVRPDRDEARKQPPLLLGEVSERFSVQRVLRRRTEVVERRRAAVDDLVASALADHLARAEVGHADRDRRDENDRDRNDDSHRNMAIARPLGGAARMSDQQRRRHHGEIRNHQEPVVHARQQRACGARDKRCWRRRAAPARAAAGAPPTRASTRSAADRRRRARRPADGAPADTSSDTSATGTTETQ